MIEDPLLATMGSTFGTSDPLTPPVDRQLDRQLDSDFFDIDSKRPDSPMADQFTEDPFHLIPLEPQVDAKKPHLITHPRQSMQLLRRSLASFTRIPAARLASSRCKAARAAYRTSRRPLMETSAPDRIPSTPSPAPQGCIRKPSTKVIEVQRSLRLRKAITRPVQANVRHTAPQPSQDEGPTATQLVQYELPPYLTGYGPNPAGRLDGNEMIGELKELIVSLRETISQQNSVITRQNALSESVQVSIEAIKAEQQYLKNQNSELQETIGSLRPQLDTLSASPPSTQTWASVAAGINPAASARTLSRTASSGRASQKQGKEQHEQHRQLVINIRRAG
ncbi:hypothetical protein DM02DRAFT_678005 [Periconia macrospinosa]|uniref:Uncharacterized protein n=1 Tax=Periconia macrospinosa TaxID=97972 RepID=A0A2V1D0N5_9PLEO|nr:hypothetical protein DM02DRAFT_678005 [Periconia macrospinosa]